MKTSITLKQLSNLSGFSVSTVSKALNNKYDISPKTRKLIKVLAEENNYIPNNHAVSLRKKRTNNIAIILPRINDEFYSCFLFHIEKVAYKLGYRITLFQSFEKYDKVKDCIFKINNGSVDGIVLLSQKRMIYNTTSTIDNFPIERIKISKDKTQKELKEDCISSFKKLIKLLKQEEKEVY
ncbi:LacI family DNA-binding transcriptional regulator [Tenacibaculum sp. M341]|uniref:LacI family DNA-binding transcriptional regulator n=1 Tax=Tenacibaculum sp. M341 TaxID=2530339 RepID=UPI00104676EE|nr:LacI family DNA-binding transcriptional regulator [Tenacibaculum sp. M341]TCI85701.1 LacI family transcriptional regulator [Tenacibaculum sp. M341]